MARPKKVDDKSKVPVGAMPPQVQQQQPVMMPHPGGPVPMPVMMAQPTPQQMQHQMQAHQHQQVQQPVVPHQQPQPVPQGMPRAIDSDNFLRVRDSVSPTLVSIALTALTPRVAGESVSSFCFTLSIQVLHVLCLAFVCG